MTDPINRNTILHALAQRGCACELQVFDEIDSTNSWLLAQVRAGTSWPLACIADAQRQGRGRRGHSWHSPPASNLYLSLAWKFSPTPAALTRLSLLVGIALIRALQECGVVNARLKWPNDVLVAGRKLAGILIETTGVSPAAVSVVIGIGMNVHMTAEQRSHIDQPCTDVSECAAQPVARNTLAVAVLAQCLDVCAGFPANAAALLELYRRHYDALAEQPVVIRHGDGRYDEGVALGVNPAGELRVLVAGTEQLLNSAEVSLKVMPC
jgi:BirA family biotin operon repressor/biotin-[acetyl-CoA-carboxylase] ligase